MWSFPKGHGEYRELPLEACIRELREETGINLKGRQPDDEIRFRSGTYFVFFVDERIPLIPEDTKEVMEAMWTPVSRLSCLSGNKDLRSFCKCINLTHIFDKMVSRQVL
jgi:8-oxo-dGTP pyrophosphatase MutT (NUDIX family)